MMIDPTRMNTYSIRAPRGTHFRSVTCEQAGCVAFTNGWISVIDETTDAGKAQAHYIRKQSGRSFTESARDSSLTEFRFTAGQRCFNSGSHQVRTDRPEIYVINSGGNPVKHSASTFVESWQENSDRLSRIYGG